MNLKEIDQLSRKLAMVLSEKKESPLIELLEILPPLSKPEIKVGQVWLIKKKNNQQLILITNIEDGLRGLLVLSETWLATHQDILISKEQSDLQMDIMVGVWSEIETSSKWLEGVLGAVSEDSMQTILQVLQREKRGGFRLRAIGKSFDLGFPMVQWKIASSREESLFYTGTRVTEDDGRLVARKELQFFWKQFHEVTPTYLELFDRLKDNVEKWIQDRQGEIKSLQMANPRLMAGALRNPQREEKKRKIGFEIQENDLSISVQIEMTEDDISLLLMCTPMPSEIEKITLKWGMKNGEKHQETKKFSVAPVLAFPRYPLTEVETMSVQIDYKNQTRLIPLF